LTKALTIPKYQRQEVLEVRAACFISRQQGKTSSSLKITAGTVLSFHLNIN
jgi:hypothetical protein